jgi:hypothetical protein
VSSARIRRAAGRKFAGVLPVRGGPVVIQQAGRGQGEGAGANRDHPGAASGRLAQRRTDLLTGIIQRQATRHHHRVGGRQSLQAAFGVHRR